MVIASRKQHSSTEKSNLAPPMPWVLTGIVSVGLVSLSGFWITVVVWSWTTAEADPALDMWSSSAGIVLALTHVSLLTIAVLMRQQWAASTIVVFLGLEAWLLSIACFAFEPAMILICLAAFTFALYFAMCYWRYKAFNYPSFFILLEGMPGFFEGR